MNLESLKGERFKTLLLTTTTKSVLKIQRRKRKVFLMKDCPMLNENDLLIFFERKANRKESCVQTYCFVDYVLTGTPAQVWKKTEKTCGIRKTDFFAKYGDCEKVFGISLKAVVSLPEPIFFPKIKLALPDFVVPKAYTFISLNVLKNRLQANISETPLQPYYVYLAQDRNPRKSKLKDDLHLNDKKMRLCFLGISMRYKLIQQNLRYYYPNLELVSYVAFPTRAKASAFLESLEEKYEDGYIEGKWYELALDECVDILNKFEEKHKEFPIHHYLAK
jgi:hypothetical protein